MAFDDKLQYYFKAIDEVEALPLVKDQESIRLHMGPLASSVKEHAKQWVNHLGKILHDSAKENLFQLRDQLDVSLVYKELRTVVLTHLFQVIPVPNELFDFM